jgi:hypothetical protein
MLFSLNGFALVKLLHFYMQRGIFLKRNIGKGLLIMDMIVVLVHVYMHWAQIGKTLFEVFRDENAPKLTDTVCEAITHLEYYSGEFDIEWGKDVTSTSEFIWHDKEQQSFKAWLIENNLDPKNPKLSLGYLPIGKVDLERSFNTTDMITIHNILSRYLDIYSIEVDGIKNTFEYCWTDADYKQQQIDMMRPGYDFSSRG